MKMASGGAEEAGFWLPAEFLTDDDFLMEKENFNKRNDTESDSEFCFPTEFPYDFDAQTDHLLEKFWMMSTSPQSTLANFGSAGASSNGSPNAMPSPPTSPLGAKYDAVGDLIYLAAGQIAKFKLNRGYGEKDLSAPPRSHAQFYPEPKSPISSVYPLTHKQQNEGCEMFYSRQNMFQNRGGMGQAAWTPQQNPTHGRAILFAGSGGTAAKRSCAGTGVFLPRRYENMSNGNSFSSDSLRRPGVSYPGKAAVHFHTKHRLDDVNGFVPRQLQPQPQPQPQPRVKQGFAPDYYSLIARRHALVMQQRRGLLVEGSSMIGHDLYLPHEWSY